MAGLTIHSEKLTPALAKELSALCPFGALEETAEGLAVGACLLYTSPSPRDCS